MKISRVVMVYAVCVAFAIAAVAVASGVRATDDASAAAPEPAIVAAVPFVDPHTLVRIDPRDTQCATPEQRVSFAFQLETEVLDESVANATGHAIALKLVTSNVTLNGCRYTAPPTDAATQQPQAGGYVYELITAADVFSADECAKLIAFAESKHLFAGRRAPLPATAAATDAQKAAAATATAAAEPVPDAPSGYVNESLAHEFGLELEPLEDRLAAWLNVSVEELEYFQIIKLVDGSAYSSAPFQLSPSRDIDYTNSRMPLTGDDVLIAEAIQHHRIASVFVFLSDGGGSDGGWTQFPGTLNVRVQPRTGSALYWPTPTPPAVEYNGTDPLEAEAAVRAVTPRPVVHVAEPTTGGGSGGGGVRYGLNVWVYPNVWRGDVEDIDVAGDELLMGTGGDDAVFDDEDEAMDGDDDLDGSDEELREFDAEDDEDLDRASPEVDVGGASSSSSAAAMATEDDDDDLEPPGGGAEDDDDADAVVEDDDDDNDDAAEVEDDDNPFLQYMSAAELQAMAAKLAAEGKADAAGAATGASGAAAADGAKPAAAAAAHVHTEL